MPNNHKLVCARAARHEFSHAYRRAISDYRRARLAAAICGRHLLARLPDALSLTPLAYLCDEGVAHFAWDGSVKTDNAGARAREAPFRVMARKRPLQPQELEADQYDSVSVEGRNNAVVVHDGRVHRDGRTLYTVHSRFCLDRIFGESECNGTVYEDAGKPLLQAALDGRRATLIFFGQTGTGKTYTARGVLDLLAADLFQQVPAVTLLSYELAGTRGGREACFDLLAGRAPVKCLTGEDGQVHVRGAKAVRCASVAELRQALDLAFESRASETTERNAASSRSHAVIELQVTAPAGDAAIDAAEGDAATSGSTGVLRVVDLAGSERNFDTQLHTRSMAERGGHINYSLLMLKECARVMHRNRRIRDEGKANKEQHVPFRSSRLTHLLQSCFTDEDHRTVVVTTLSPSPTDVEHSLNSLQHVGMMRAVHQQDRGQGSAPRSSGGKGEAGFLQVEGRGHALHSKLQDARAGQLKLHAFNMVTEVGGSIRKKYEADDIKTEAFIDPRWHTEMAVQVEEEDLWVLRDADAEVIQVLTEWREEQWQARKAHDLARWDAATVRAFVQSLSLPGQVRIPSTMTGAQLRRLGRRGLVSLCSDEATATALYEALLGEQTANTEFAMSHRDKNAKITALGANKVRVALETA